MRFQHRPLDTKANEIRLLTPRKGAGNAEIQCSLENVPLGDYSRHGEFDIFRWSTGEQLHMASGKTNKAGEAVLTMSV